MKTLFGLALVASLSGCQPAATPIETKEMSMQTAEQTNRVAVQQGFDRWRAGTGSPFEMLAPDAKWTIVGNSPMSRTYHSKQELMDAVITPFNKRLSKPLVPTMRGIYVDGDMVIALFDGEGVAKDGKPYRNTYSWNMRMKDGWIVEVIAFFDTIEFTDFWNRIAP